MTIDGGKIATDGGTPLLREMNRMPGLTEVPDSPSPTKCSDYGKAAAMLVGECEIP